MSHTLTIPSAPPVARSVPVSSIATVITGVVCGFTVLNSTELIEVGLFLECSSANILIEREREHVMRCDPEGVTFENWSVQPDSGV